MGAAYPTVQAAPRPLSQRVARAFDRWMLPIYAVAAVLYLMLPVIVMIVFSFNNPAGKFNFVWREFSLAAWQNPLGPPGAGRFYNGGRRPVSLSGRKDYLFEGAQA